ncbi:MAG: hypothetical protein R2939_17965 [Kofleriaceae bacterium]
MTKLPLRSTVCATGLLVALAAAALAEPEPEPRRPPPPRTPPAQALAACDGADEGDPCDFEHDGRTLTGTCRVPPRAERLACVPTGHPPPPRGEGADRGAP